MSQNNKLAEQQPQQYQLYENRQIPNYYGHPNQPPQMPYQYPPPPYKYRQNYHQPLPSAQYYNQRDYYSPYSYRHDQPYYQQQHHHYNYIPPKHLPPPPPPYPHPHHHLHHHHYPPPPPAPHPNQYHNHIIPPYNYYRYEQQFEEYPNQVENLPYRETFRAPLQKPLKIKVEDIQLKQEKEAFQPKIEVNQKNSTQNHYQKIDEREQKLTFKIKSEQDDQQHNQNNQNEEILSSKQVISSAEIIQNDNISDQKQQKSITTENINDQNTQILIKIEQQQLQKDCFQMKNLQEKKEYVEQSSHEKEDQEDFDKESNVYLENEIDDQNNSQENQSQLDQSKEIDKQADKEEKSTNKKQRKRKEFKPYKNQKLKTLNEVDQRRHLILAQETKNVSKNICLRLSKFATAERVKFNSISKLREYLLKNKDKQDIQKMIDYLQYEFLIDIAHQTRNKMKIIYVKYRLKFINGLKDLDNFKQLKF